MPPVGQVDVGLDLLDGPRGRDRLSVIGQVLDVEGKDPAPSALLRQHGTLQDGPMLTSEQLSALIADHGSDRLELTERTNSTDKFGEAICAFANDFADHGRPGHLLVGVTDRPRTRRSWPTLNLWPSCMTIPYTLDPKG